LRTFCREKDGNESQRAKETGEEDFPTLNKIGIALGNARTKPFIGVEQQTCGIMGGRRPYEKNQREEKYDVPRIFDQFDQQILRLRHKAKQCETDSKGANRNAYDPKDVREIEDIAPGAWDVTTYHGPKGARVISYLLPGTWDVGMAKSVGHVRPRSAIHNGDQRADSSWPPAATENDVIGNSVEAPRIIGALLLPMSARVVRMAGR
jgi:hypothetical protein